MQKRNLILQAAIAGALGIVGVSSQAATLGQSTPDTYAKEITSGAAQVVFPVADTKWAPTGSEVYIGRSTAMTVTYNLPAGTTFKNAVQANVTNATTCGSATTFTATIVGGGTAGGSFVKVSLSPANTVAGNNSKLTSCTTFTVTDSGSTTVLTLAGSTIASGASQTATATAQDPVSGNTFETVMGTLGVAKNAVTLTGSASTDMFKFIDVKATVNNIPNGTANPLGLFTSPTSAPAAGSAANVFPAGTVTVNVNTAYLDATGVASTVPEYSPINLSMSKSSSADQLTFAPFALSTSDTEGVALNTDTTCATATGAGVVNATAANTGTSVSWPATVMGTALAANTVKAGQAYEVCLALPIGNTTPILTGTPIVSLTGVTATTTASTYTEVGQSASMLKLQPNGWTSHLDTMVPASETAGPASASAPLAGYWQYVRVTNTTGQGGAVYGTLTDDTGKSVTGTLISSLGGGASQMMTVGQVETAIGFTNPTGRLRLDVFGIFATGQLQTFLATPGGDFTNMTKYNN